MVSDHNSIDSLLHGPNSKLFIIGGAGVLIIMLYENRKRKANAAAAAVTTATATDTTSTDTTGGGYGDLSGYDSYGGGYSGATLASYTDPATGAVITGSGAQTILAPSTNSQWMQQAQAMLTNEGYDPITVSAALGEALHGVEVTPDAATIVYAAMGLLGQPPQGMPPLRVAPTSATGGTTAPVPDGYYVQIPFNLHYQVQGGRLYRLGPQTVAQLNKQHVHWITTLISSPVYSLPRGNPYQI